VCASQLVCCQFLAIACNCVPSVDLAAGILGMVKVVQQVSGRAAAALLHLRALNPLLNSALEQGMMAGHSSGTSWAALPRQHVPDAPASCSAATPHMCGISGFAFQGTNAHVLLAGNTQTSHSALATSHLDMDCTRTLPLEAVRTQQRVERMWVHPAMHPCLTSVIPSPTPETAVFACR
jgi:acyl transferase domain-containing protein